MSPLILKGLSSACVSSAFKSSMGLRGLSRIHGVNLREGGQCIGGVMDFLLVLRP